MGTYVSVRILHDGHEGGLNCVPKLKPEQYDTRVAV